jgi:hypothetical protein
MVGAGRSAPALPIAHLPSAASSSHKFPTRVSYRQFHVVDLTKMLAI